MTIINARHRFTERQLWDAYARCREGAPAVRDYIERIDRAIALIKSWEKK